MTNLYYAKRSKFFLPIKEKLESNFSEKIFIDLSYISQHKGYEGEYKIQIEETFFSANFSNPDQSRFPQRIRTSATVLSKLKLYGRFLIKHEKKILTIQKIY